MQYRKTHQVIFASQEIRDIIANAAFARASSQFPEDCSVEEAQVILSYDDSQIYLALTEAELDTLDVEDDDHTITLTVEVVREVSADEEDEEDEVDPPRIEPLGVHADDGGSPL
jgi:hypothetical protein